MRPVECLDAALIGPEGTGPAPRSREGLPAALAGLYSE